MKFLLISPISPPIGGIASWTENLLEYYNINKSDWDVFHQNSAIKYRNITNGNIWDRLYGGIKDSVQIIKKLKYNIKKCKPDIIHLTSSASLALLKDYILVRIAAQNNIPLVIHFRFGRIPFLAKRKNWEWWLITSVIRKCFKVIVIDQRSFDTLINAGFKNVVNIPNPISLELEKRALVQKEISRYRIKGQVLFVGHVSQNKGVFELVEACTSIPEIRDLVFVGPYEEKIKDELLNIAQKRGNNHWIKFKGSLTKKEVLSYLSNTSILTLPSYTEGFPNIILEAMAMCCPIIATNVGAIPQMLDCASENTCGLCINPKEVIELSNAISSFVSNEELALKMANNGLDRVLKNYTLSNIIPQYEQVWLEAYSNIKN